MLPSFVSERDKGTMDGVMAAATATATMICIIISQLMAARLLRKGREESRDHLTFFSGVEFGRNKIVQG